MKRYILGAALMTLPGTAFAADPMTATPAAQNSCSGHVEAYIGGLYVTQSGLDDTFTTYGGAARANCNFQDRWNVQGDLVVDSLDANGTSFTKYGGAAHLFWRDPSSYAFGVFGSINKTDVGPGDFTGYSGGPEFQVYMDQVTFYGQAEYGQLDIQGNSVDFWGARGVVRYFAKPNLRFDVELAYRSYDPLPIDIFYAAAQANYRFDNTPYTVFARYQFEAVSISGIGSDADLHKFSAGLRISFGGDTLLEEDRYGATMDTYRSNYIQF